MRSPDSPRDALTRSNRLPDLVVKLITLSGELAPEADLRFSAMDCCASAGKAARLSGSWSKGTETQPLGLRTDTPLSVSAQRTSAYVLPDLVVKLNLLT